MEKIWIITFDEVSDYDEYFNAPMAFRNEEDARKELQVYKKGLQEDWAEELKDKSVVYNEGENWAEVYGDSWAQEHYAIKLVCVDLK